MHPRGLFAAGLLAALALACSWAFAAEEKVNPYDQSKVPIEKQPADPKLTKVVLVAGRASHGPGEHEFFAGCAILMKLLRQTPGVFPVMARDGWPKDPKKTFAGAKCVVFYMDGGEGHPVLHKGHKDVVQKLIDRGVGFFNLHYAVEYPRRASGAVLKWLGGYYETGFSTNPHWDADFKKLPRHPITRGVRPFKLRDEWYFNIRFRPESEKLTPILVATPPDGVRGTPAAKKHKGRPEVVAWAFERGDGGRSFGFTGGHFHRNWGNEDFRRLVVNAILWGAKVEVPEGGARVELDRAELKRNLDRKGR
jgi:type 1 glutamine amidotransferase